MACVTPLSEPNYGAAALVYALDKPRSGLGCGCSTGVERKSDNAGLVSSAVGRLAMHGLEVKSTLSSRTWASFTYSPNFSVLSVTPIKFFLQDSQRQAKKGIQINITNTFQYEGSVQCSFEEGGAFCCQTLDCC